VPKEIDMTMSAYREGLAGSSRPTKIAERVGICVEYGQLRLSFSEERGYGRSLFQIGVRPDSFADLAQAMMHANREAAIKAFGTALQNGIPEPTEGDTIWTPEVRT
jgi:hypothetical protein